jgi:LacI family transcriptional regulator
VSVVGPPPSDRRPRRTPVGTRANATVRDVARLAGVSIATVSRALSQPAVVRQQTRERVDQAIAELNYVADGAARALTTRRTRTVGALIPTLDNAIYAVSTHALQKTLEQANYTVLLACHEFDLAAEARLVRVFAERGVDALALVGTVHAEATERLLASLAIPHVLTWSIDRRRRNLCVGFDNRAAGRLIAEHLLQLGHRRIGMLSGIRDGNDRANDRLNGVRAALRRAGADLPDAAIEEVSYSLEDGRAGLGSLLARHPVTAVVCGNDVLAIGAIQQAQQLGLQVPDDLSITGFDDMSFATVVSPALTTVRFPIAEVGVQAAHHLIAQLEGGGRPRSVELPVQLVVRRSTAPPARVQVAGTRRQPQASPGLR